MLPRLLRRYLLVSGLLLNLGVAGMLVAEWASDAPLLVPAANRLLGALEAREPALGAWARAAATTIGLPALHGGTGDAPHPSRADTPDLGFAPVSTVFAATSAPAGVRVLTVGPGQALATPSAAAAVARDGDIVEIEPGHYPGDTAVWPQHQLTLRGRGGMVWLDARDTPLPQIKGIWLIQGDAVTVENIAFLNARSPDRNGAGIRAEGTDITIRNCYFHGNETGLLSNPSPASKVLIEHSEFAWNGHEDGQAHNLYIGEAARLVFRFNHVHHAYVGSNLKSRARENRILYNRLGDGAGGYGNYVIDLSDGGLAFVIGNVLHQSAVGENYHLLAFAPESSTRSPQALYVVNNTFVNDRDAGVFIHNHARSPAYVYNNLFIGAGALLVGPGFEMGDLVQRESNVWTTIRGFFGGAGTDGEPRVVTTPQTVDAVAGDYRLAPGVAAIDAGAALGEADRMSLTPRYEYAEPRSGQPRPLVGRIDIGAFEAR